jgi:hypothetical protein
MLTRRGLVTVYTIIVSIFSESESLIDLVQL